MVLLLLIILLLLLLTILTMEFYSPFGASKRITAMLIRSSCD